MTGIVQSKKKNACIVIANGNTAGNRILRGGEKISDDSKYSYAKPVQTWSAGPANDLSELETNAGSRMVSYCAGIGKRGDHQFTFFAHALKPIDYVCV